MGGWDDEKYDCSTCKEQKLYTSRNCSKYFPDELKEDPPDQWAAVHRATGCDNPYQPDVTCKECPVSYITDESHELIQINLQQDIAQKATGAALYGPDLSKWPSKLVHAIRIIHSENNMIQNGLHELQMNQR